MNADIDQSWKAALAEEFASDWFGELAAFVRGEYAAGKHIYPQPENIFKAFNTTPFNKVRVVMLGQDPYHGFAAGQPQAQGLCFSVPGDVPNPPSLKNIFKEIAANTGGPAQAETEYGGDLTSWAEQGVLLLNAVLTVEQSKPGSHANRGWEKVTDAAIQKLSDEREGVVFLLWGGYARKKKQLIDAAKHTVLEAPHPSPLSAHRGFMGCKHFTQCNEHLQKPIIW